MKVAYDFNRRVFAIQCSMAENGMLDALDDRRFNKSRREWVVAARPRTSRTMVDKFHRFMDEGTLKVAQELSLQVKIPPAQTDYPAEYLATLPWPPLDHQLVGMHRHHAFNEYALFMEMGTGKTYESLVLMFARAMQGDIRGILIVAPNAVQLNWLLEIEKYWPMEHFPVDVHRIQAGPRASKKVDGFMRRRHKFPIVIAASESLSGKRSTALAAIALYQGMLGASTGLIVDESHFFKNFKSARTDNMIEIGSRAKVKTILTGTSVSQGQIDLFTQFQILNPDILDFGSYYSFRGHFAKMGGYSGKDIVGYKNLDELYDLIRPYTYQCLKADVLDLPDKVHTVREVDMTPEQGQIFRDIRYRLKTVLRGELVPENGSVEKDITVKLEHTLTAYLMMMQIASGFFTYLEPLPGEGDEDAESNSEPELDYEGLLEWINAEESREKVLLAGDEAKLPRHKRERLVHRILEPHHNPKVLEVIDTVEYYGVEQAVIWCRFLIEVEDVVTGLRAKYGEDSVVEFHGGIPIEERQQGRIDFMEGRHRFFVATQQCGGTGIGLTCAQLSIFLSNSWHFVDRMQAEDRTHRLGQEGQCIYVDIIARRSLDLRIANCLADKTDLADHLKAALREGDFEALMPPED